MGLQTTDELQDITVNARSTTPSSLELLLENVTTPDEAAQPEPEPVGGTEEAAQAPPAEPETLYVDVPTDVDLFNEFADQLSQCAIADDVRALQVQYADAFSVEYSQKAQAKAEMRLAEIKGRKPTKLKPKAELFDADGGMVDRE
jgi:hypothetical protein